MVSALMAILYPNCGEYLTEGCHLIIDYYEEQECLLDSHTAVITSMISLPVISM